MLQKLRDDIMSEFGKIGETRSSQFAVLGEDLSTTKKPGEWKTAFAEELNLIRARKATLKEKNRTIERWKELEIRRAAIRKDVAELDVAYANTRQELEIHFEDIGTAARQDRYSPGGPPPGLRTALGPESRGTFKGHKKTRGKKQFSSEKEVRTKARPLAV